MTGVHAFRGGCRAATRTPGLVLALYAANLLLALPLAVAFRSTMENAFGPSMAPEALLEGFDASVLRDLLAHSGNAFRGLVRAAVPTALLGTLVHTVMAGGILTILVRDQPFSAALFFEGIGRTIGRFLRLWMVLAVIGGILFLFLSGVSGMIAGAAMESSSGRTEVVGLVLALCAYVPLLFVVMAGDYAKIHIVADDESSVWRAAGAGFLFLLRNPASTLLLQACFLFLLGLCAATYWGVDALIGMDSAGTIVAMFVIQQVFVGFRGWIRTATYAGAVVLFRARKPHPVVFYGWEDSPARESI